MKKTKIIAISNQKGGVGKTTTAHNLGAGLARAGFQVLLVDLDPQGNLTAATGCKADVPNAYHLLVDSSMRSPENWPVYSCNIRNAEIIPSSPKLAHIDIELSGVLGSEYNLRAAFEEEQTGHYNYIIIDTPPALGKLTINALTAADELIIPVQADMFSLQGFAQIRDTIEIVRRYSNKELRIAGILLTRYKKTVLSRDVEEMLEQVAKDCETKLFKARIADRVAIKEAQMRQLDIFAYKSYSAAALDYKQLVREVLLRG